jgi:hypothetical protein
VKRFAAIRAIGSRRVFHLGFEQVQHFIGQWAQLSAPGHIDRPVPGCAEGPRENVVSTAKLRAMLKRREYHLLKDVVCRVNIAHHGGRQSRDPHTLTQEYLNDRVRFERHRESLQSLHEQRGPILTRFFTIVFFRAWLACRRFALHSSQRFSVAVGQWRLLRDDYHRLRAFGVWSGPGFGPPQRNGAARYAKM